MANAVGLGARGLSIYASNGFDPKFVADFTVEDDYFRVAGNDATFSDAFTGDSEAGGLVVQKDSSGNAVWGAHNAVVASEDLTDAAYTKTNVTATEGALTAVASGSPVNTRASQSFSGLPSNATVTIACDATYDTVQWVGFRWRGKSGIVKDVSFDIQNGVVGVDDTGAATITATSSGYEIAADFDTNSGGTTPSIDLYLLEGDDDFQWSSTDGSESAGLTKIRLYRSDLGGMADVPSDERAASSLNKYVPTTTAARYLLRRGHYDYDGSTYNRTCLHEPEGATNELTYSRDLSQWATVGSNLSEAKDAIGFDGVSNSAYTLTDSGGDFSYKRDDVTVPDDSNPAAVSFLVAKDASPTSYPGVGFLFMRGSTTLSYRFTVDPSDGTLVKRSTSAAATATYVEDWNDNFWRVTIVGPNNSTGNTTLRAECLPAVNTDGSATWATSASGSHVFDQVDVVLNASIPSSPIITAGAAVTRSADTMKGKAASLPFSSTAISMAVKGRYSFTSSDAGLLDWYPNGTNRMLMQRFGGSARVYIASSGATDNASDGALSAGLRVAASVAARWVGGSALQSAEGGSAGTENTTGIESIPDLTAGDLFVSQLGNGTQNAASQVDTIRLWDEDVETSGLTEATS